jgi:predicted amidohydrolase YtcJ
MKKADYILYSNCIDTVGKQGIINGGIAISGNKILAVGTREELEIYKYQDTVMKEYGDCLITPGLCEAHMHIFEGAKVDSVYFCSDIIYSKSEEDCVRIVKEFAEKHPDYPCYCGGGWFPATWNDAPLPTKKSLDEILPDKPVYLDAADFHTVWTNSKGMEAAGITREMAAEIQGIGTFPDGELNGIFKEEAANLLRPFYKAVPEEKKESLILDMFQRMNRYGITSVGDVSYVSAGKGREEFKPLAKYFREDNLPMRVSLYMGQSLEPYKEEELQEVLDFKNTYSDDMLRVSGLKFMVDGVTSTHTAALLEPYSDKTGECGFMNHPEEVFEQAVVNANRAGLSVRVHAIGDLAVRKSLDWFEKGQKAASENGKLSGLRNAVEHIESIAKEDIPRFRNLNVTASMQPIHLIQDAGEKEYRIGVRRCRYEWPVRSLQEKGAILAFGTDFPVEHYNVFRNLHAAVTRSTSHGITVGVNASEEVITMEDALWHYTWGGAYLMGMEDRLGSLEPGKYADIAVFNCNLLTLAADEIEKAEVEFTMVNGKVVYEKEYEKN